MTASFQFLRRHWRFATYRSPYVRLHLFLPFVNVAIRDSSYDESHIPTTHLTSGRLSLAWRHRG